MDSDSLKNYTCPAWKGIPDIELYMDQVISLLERMLAPFFREEEKRITSTMIQNYVKQRIIPAPQNKRYTRAHLALLFIVCLWKKFMLLSEISLLLVELQKTRDVESLYTFFAGELTTAMRRVFRDGPEESAPLTAPVENAVRAGCYAFASVTYARLALDKCVLPPAEEKKSAPQKDKKKKDEAKKSKAKD